MKYMSIRAKMMVVGIVLGMMGSRNPGGAGCGRQDWPGRISGGAVTGAAGRIWRLADRRTDACQG